MSSHVDIMLRSADEEDQNRDIVYITYKINVGNGLHKEIRFTVNNHYSYITHYLFRYLKPEAIQKLADNMMVARMEYIKKIYNGYDKTRGKFDYIGALSFINEYLGSQTTKDEFEYRNFSGAFKWSEPQKWDRSSEHENPFKVVEGKRKDILDINPIPVYDWLFSHSLYTPYPIGIVESCHRARQQRLTFGKELPKPQGWNFDDWIEDFRKREGPKKPIHENTPSKKEMICSFVGMVNSNKFREFRVRYTTEMMNFEVKDLNALLEEVEGYIRTREYESDHAFMWGTVRTGLNLNNVKYLYAMFKQGPEAVLRFEKENTDEETTQWNDPKPIFNFLKFFNKTIHYETEVEAPTVKQVDPVIREASIEFLNKIKGASTIEPKTLEAIIRAIPLTEKDLYPELFVEAETSDSLNETNKVTVTSPHQTETENVVEKETTTNSGVESPVGDNANNDNTKTAKTECVTTSISYARIVEKNQKPVELSATSSIMNDEKKEMPQSSSPCHKTVSIEKQPLNGLDQENCANVNGNNDESEWRTVVSKSNGSRAEKHADATPKKEDLTMKKNRKEKQVEHPVEPKLYIEQASNGSACTIPIINTTSAKSPIQLHTKQDKEQPRLQENEKIVSPKKSVIIKNNELNLEKTNSEEPQVGERGRKSIHDDTSSPESSDSPVSGTTGVFKETKTAVKKAKKAAKALLKEQQNTTPRCDPLPQIDQKLVISADDGTFVEADIQVNSKKSNGKSNKKSKKSKEGTAVEAEFSEDLATVSINQALFEVQRDLIHIPEESLSSNIEYTKLIDEPDEASPDEYVPGTTVTYDYRPGAECQQAVVSASSENDGETAKSENEEESQHTNSHLPITNREIIEWASDPELHDMFCRLKFLADKKARGGLQKIDKNRQSIIRSRLVKFMNVYNFRYRVAAAMVYILDTDEHKDPTGLREQSVLRLMMGYIAEKVENDADTLRGRHFKQLAEKLTKFTESEIITKGTRFIDLKIVEVLPTHPFYAQYTAIGERLVTLMKDQEVLLKIIGNNVDFDGYKEYANLNQNSTFT